MSSRNNDAPSLGKKPKKEYILSPLRSSLAPIDLCYSDERSDSPIPSNSIQRSSKQKRVKEEDQIVKNEHSSKKVKTEDNKDKAISSSKTVTPKKPRRCGLCNETTDECHMQIYGKHCFNSCKKAIANHGAHNMTIQEINDIFFRSYLDAAEFYSQYKLNEEVDYSHLKDVHLPPCMAEITYEDTMIYFQKQINRVIRKKIQRKKDGSESMVRED